MTIFKDDDGKNKIQCSALRYLAKRDYSQHELTQKLIKQGYALESIAIAIAELNQTGALNDSRFVENFICFRRNKGYGPQRISMELQAHGISKEMIAEQLQIIDNDWLTQAQHVWRKRFKGQLPKNFKEQAKQMNFMKNRGFTTEQIANIFQIHD